MVSPSVTAVAEPGAPVRGAIRLRGLSKRFGDHLAVDRLDLDVAPGEFVSLLGPSGCGKTTTLRMLAGFERPDAGEICVSGARVDGVPANRRDVNTVFQAYALFPHMTVAENVAYGLRQGKVPRTELSTRVAAALDMVRMRPMADRRPRQLSGGQQQRVALARALVCRPSVLLLDEPLAALDRKLREEMQVELKLLQQELGITFVFVTHDQGEALSMSDRVAVMLDGRIEQLDDPFGVYERPASAFVAGFIGQQNFAHGVVRADGSTISTTVHDVVATRAPGPPGARVLVAVRPEAIAVVAPHGGQRANAVGGAVRAVAHLGDSIQLVLHVPGHGELLVRRPRTAGAVPAVGDPVTCTWSADDVHVFPATEGDAGPSLPD